jgi:hypothetical protein
MVGWFSLNVPSGLGLYYFSNTFFTTTQQVFLRKLGGAKTKEFNLGPLDLGMARRTGASAVSSSLDLDLDDTPTLVVDEDDEGVGANGVGAMQYSGEGEAMASAAFAAAEAAAPTMNRRCKRLRRVSVAQ